MPAHPYGFTDEEVDIMINDDIKYQIRREGTEDRE